MLRADDDLSQSILVLYPWTSQFSHTLTYFVLLSFHETQFLYLDLRLLTERSYGE